MGTLAGNSSAGTFQILDYKYHIRGGLKSINTDANNDLTNSLFSYKLTYEDGGFYDGNIGNQYWRSSIDGKQRVYAYQYDGASRLKSVAYASTQAGENYALNNVDYDGNGNITNLSRNGLKSNNTFGLIDNLSYSYETNSNRLNSVNDLVSGNLNIGDFRDGTNSTNDYEYWADGALKKDLNKGILEIQYNYLKLPKKITFSSGQVIDYQYDATGKKLKKVVSNGATTDYLGNLIYENGVLYHISHDEGRIVNGIYEYNFNDHLGNLRVAFKDSSGIAKITQAQDYDPFGLENWTSKFSNIGKLNNFKYNSKETQIETGCIDLGNRMVNPTIGRMLSVDRFAEKYFEMSGLQFAANNPISNIDVNGDSTMYFNSQGVVLYTSNDQLENAITFISDDNLENFQKSLDSYKKRQETKEYKKNSKEEDIQANAVLRGYYGKSYMIDGFKKFYDNNKNDLLWNPKFNQMTHAEHGSYLYESNNTIRIGTENFGGGRESVVFGDKPQNAVGKLHTHDDIKLYNESPSSWDMEYHTSNRGIYNVVVGPNNIYLYNNKENASLIKIPKNNTFKK